MRTAIAVTLLLTSCRTATAASTSSAAPEQPPSTTGTPPTSNAEAAFPARLTLTTKDGRVLTLSRGAEPVVTAGVTAPTGEVLVSAAAADGHTTVEWHDLRTDAVTASVQIDGTVRPAAVDQHGTLVALISSTATSTTVVLATPSQGEVRRWAFDAVVVPEAFANVFDPAAEGLPIGVFVIEYLAADTYRVRVIDTATGELGPPFNFRDKSQTVDEIMTAVSRTAVFEPNHQLLFTLYQDATEGGENVGSFIHTLGLVNGVWCLDVPAELGLADHPGAMAVSPDGSRLYAASSIGGVAGYQVSDIINNGPEMPKARSLVSLGTSTPAVAIGASADQVVVALGGSIFRRDPTTLVGKDHFTWDMAVEALSVLDDGSVVIVGSGRMTLVSADDQILAERILPVGVGEVTHVSVLD